MKSTFSFGALFLAVPFALSFSQPAFAFNPVPTAGLPATLLLLNQGSNDGERSLSNGSGSSSPATEEAVVKGAIAGMAAGCAGGAVLGATKGARMPGMKTTTFDRVLVGSLGCAAGGLMGIVPGATAGGHFSSELSEEEMQEAKEIEGGLEEMPFQ
jgi:hypothetical protein